jgi:chemotaxis signal transduction protein
MTEEGRVVPLRIEALREDFDRSFAKKPAAVPASDDLLEISIAGRPYALRIAEVSGIFVDRIVAPLPTAVVGLLGICGIRGALLPVYDLGTMLEHPTERSQHRWLAIAAGTFVGLAFERFTEHVRVGRDAIVSHDSDTRAMRHVREFVSIRERMTPIVSIVSVLETIRSRAAGSVPSPEEQ